jgi:hypothetical protein
MAMSIGGDCSCRQQRCTSIGLGCCHPESESYNSGVKFRWILFKRRKARLERCVCRRDESSRLAISEV